MNYGCRLVTLYRRRKSRPSRRKRNAKKQNGCLWKEGKQKAKGKRKDIPICVQSSKEQQEEIRKPSSVVNAKKCEEIEGNNRMGKTRDLFKKIRDTKGTFHAKMGTIKDWNGRDLTEAEDIKKRWQEYTELYKKDLQDQDNHDGMITHLEPDILECESSGP